MELCVFLLIKSYRIIGTTGDGKEFVIDVDNSHQRFVTHTVDWKVKKLEFIPISTYGRDDFRVFRFEVEKVSKMR